jgi:hypothetical protein
MPELLEIVLKVLGVLAAFLVLPLLVGQFGHADDWPHDA